MLFVKLFMPDTFEDIVIVRVAVTDSPADSTVPSLSIDIVMNEAALAGLQLVTLKPRVMGAVPVFFM